jgi:hypothetical protein
VKGQKSFCGNKKKKPNRKAIKKPLMKKKDAPKREMAPRAEPAIKCGRNNQGQTVDA